ncbi:MAG TPA: cytoplasmic protein [Longimicrobium sp.]|jgi:NAD-dependent SIR2 family protein deacetylase
MADGAEGPITREVLDDAHGHSSLHRDEVLASESCACFYCLQHFPPGEITEWVDDGETALCPRCGIDAVLGSAGPHPLTPELLRRMNEVWFDMSVYDPEAGG